MLYIIKKIKIGVKFYLKLIKFYYLFIQNINKFLLNY